MAKTELNKKLDNFFKKNANTQITEEIFDASDLDISNANEYGNLLHAVVNYYYDELRVLEFVDVVCKKGIIVDYKGKSTGLTFLHLALYGFTRADGKDISYPEDFIIALILKAKKYGLNVNIKDNSGDDIPTCAVASEVYKGSVIKIIEALGPEYDLPEDFLNIYQNYLEEARQNGNKEWYNRLQEELDAITDYVNKKNLNLEELNLIIKEKQEELKKETSDLSYEKLIQTYKKIYALMDEIKKILVQRSLFEVDNREDEDILSIYLEKIEELLNEQLNFCEKNPNQKSLDTIKTIVTCFSLECVLKRVEEITKHYNEYLETLRNEAKSTRTLNECNNMLKQIKASEIFEELNALIQVNIGSISSAILEAEYSYSEVKGMESVAKDFIEVEDIPEKECYSDLTLEELKAVVKLNQDIMHRYQDLVRIKVTTLYQEFYASLQPLLDHDLIHQSDIKTILDSVVKKKKTKEKK